MSLNFLIGSCRQRATCSVCGRRRLCRVLALGLPGVMWMLCAEHEDWKPVEGEDYEVVT